MKDQATSDVLIGGMEKRDIEIHDYDPGWQDRFKFHARKIADALGDAALRIEHIGSTSVPGLAAKPIVDMLLIVENSANEVSYLRAMEASGYLLRVREPDFHEHRMFRTPELDVHVHVFSNGSPETERFLIFRDRLRSSIHDRRFYETTKRKLASQPWPDMNAYANAKTEVIETILAAAKAANKV